MKEKQDKKAISTAVKLLRDNGYIVTPPESDLDEKIQKSFDEFWNLYGKKVDKERAFKHWKRMKQKDRDKAISFIPTYLVTIKDKQYQKYPLTYLNARLWEEGNDFLIQRQEPTQPKQQEPSTISKQIEELRQMNPSKQINLKKEFETSRYRDMIDIYERNNNSLCAKPLLDAYKNGTLSKLGITWKPSTTSKTH